MNAASAGPTVDLAHDAVYVGTEQASPIQNSLWAFKSVSGLRAWTGFGTPAGRITQRPLLAGKRLYTTGLDNTLRATDCDSLPGSLIWSLAVASGPVADPVLDPDALSPLIAIACGGNLLRSVIDGGSFGSEIPSVSAIASAPVYLPGAGVFYAIDPTGHVQEFDSAVHIPLGPPASLCGDPALHLSLSHQPLLPSPWRLSVVGSARVLGYLTQVCVPWGYGAAPQSCGSNVAVEEPASAPATDELLPPFPNPTRSATRCAFTTSRACRAALFISDVQGRRVCRLAESEPAAGHRSLEWNGRDDAGRRVAAGIYSVRLALDGTPTRSARMVLVLR
jgi:hypothetical protein